MQHYGKICVLIEKSKRNLIIPTNKLPNGELIQLINEKNINGKINCIFRPPRKFIAPIWDKKQNGTILVFSNNGFGDNFFATRYIQSLKNTNRKLIFEARIEEAKLMKECSSYDDICIKGEPTPKHDYCIEINDLYDKKFKISFPYIKKPKIIDPLEYTKKIKVGFVLEGHYVKIGSKRSINANILNYFPKYVQLYCLQKKDHRENSQIELPKNIIDLSSKLHNWIDTASYLSQMDFLISVDTGIVHLGAGMGINVKVLLQPEHKNFYINKNDKYSCKYERNLKGYWGNPHITIKDIIKDINIYNLL